MNRDDIEDTATQDMQRSLTAFNQYQGKWPRTLCVCSAGLLRSPTLAWILSNDPWYCNTRAAGSHVEYALVPVDQVLLNWAQRVVFANPQNHQRVLNRKLVMPGEVYVLNVPDRFPYRHPELIKAIGDELVSVGFPKGDANPHGWSV